MLCPSRATKRSKKGWRTLTEKEILQLIDNVECNNETEKIENLTFMQWNVNAPDQVINSVSNTF